MTFLNFAICNSQSFINKIVSCAKHNADEKLRFAVGKQISDSNFQFIKSKTIIEVYNQTKDKLKRLTLDEFEKSEYPATQLWINYKVIDEKLVLTELSFPFNLNCTTPWSLNDTKEIIEPYLKVLQNKTKVDLEKAIEIAQENGLRNINEWDINYEKGKLIWTIKDQRTKNQWHILKIKAKTGRIISDYYHVIPMD
ncbi:PepSY domain-containing protein [Aquimarina sp. LLG6339-5]|uniref:PepSY domain-containing protein n=1 Tax=Aquimarina sp. LLG6339-5 TaxID=3160830 RepID=UPI00386B0109